MGGDVLSNKYYDPRVDPKQENIGDPGELCRVCVDMLTVLPVF